MVPEHKLKVLVSLVTSGTDYQLEQATVAERLSAKLNLSVNVEFADGDGVYQTLQILRVIQSAAGLRPDAVIVEPVGTSMVQVAQAAASANIGWVILNRDADYLTRLRARASVPIFSVSTDNEEVGRIQGKQMNALTPPGGCVMYLEGPSNSDVSRYRTSGMLSSKRPDIGLKHLRGDWTESGGYHAVRSWLQLGTIKAAEIAAVTCQNDTMALGARKAFAEVAGAERREKFLALPFTGCDGIPEKGQAYVRQGLLRATVINPPLTGVALEMLAYALRAYTQPAERTLVMPQAFPSVEKLHAAS